MQTILIDDLDLDWFCLDRDGVLVHFASGGVGLVPSDAEMHRGTCELLMQYLSTSECSFKTTVEISQIMRNKWLGMNTVHGDINKYADSFMKVAASGVYSYDTDYFNTGDRGYFLVCRPAQIATLSSFINDDIQQALSVIPTCNFSVHESDLLTEEMISAI